MDRVRFGRALGYGARHAAKTLTQAAAAASAPRPSQKTSSQKARAAANSSTGRADASGMQTAPKPSVQRRAAETVGQLRTTGKEARRASRSLFQPVKRFSSVLWLQVTGTFFALMAATTGIGAWKLRAAVHKAPTSHEAMKLWVCVVVCVVFTYFTVSSFVRAERR